MTIELGRTKTSEAEEGRAVKLVGRPVEALTAWLESEGITSGPVFLHIDRWENVGERPVSPAGINHMIKRRLVMAGYDEPDYSAHGLRPGYQIGRASWRERVCQYGLFLVERVSL